MIVLADSTVIFHLYYHKLKMQQILTELGIKEMYISNVSYLEILSGTSENAKMHVRKFLTPLN